MKNKDPNSKYYIHPEGWKFALIFFVLSFLVSLIYAPIAFMGYLLTLFTLWFFRNPKRRRKKRKRRIKNREDVTRATRIENCILNL